MKTPKLFIGLPIFILLTTVGCANSLNTNEVSSDPSKIETHKTENPDAAEILTSDPNADIFQFDGVVYQTGIDWVEELTLTKDEQVGEIKTRNDTDTKFEDEMSNKLPIGAKLFSVKKKGEVGGPILLVESEGKIIKYYGLVEG